MNASDPHTIVVYKVYILREDVPEYVQRQHAYSGYMSYAKPSPNDARTSDRQYLAHRARCRDHTRLAVATHHYFAAVGAT